MGIIIKKSSFFRIVEGEKYIAAFAKQVYFICKETGQVVWLLKGIRYPSRAVFMDDVHVLIKTTEGKYVLCNIQSRIVERVYSDRRIRSAAQDHQPCLDKLNNVLYDIISASLYERYLVRISLQSGTFEFTPLPDYGSLFNWSVFQNEFSFIANKKWGSFCETIVTYSEERFIETNLCTYEDNLCHVLWYDKDILLYRSGIIKLMGSQEVHVDLPLDARIMFRNCSYVEKRRGVLFVFSNQVRLFSMDDRTWTIILEDTEIEDAKLIHNDLYVATGNGLYRLETISQHYE